MCDDPRRQACRSDHTPPQTGTPGLCPGPRAQRHRVADGATNSAGGCPSGLTHHIDASRTQRTRPQPGTGGSKRQAPAPSTPGTSLRTAPPDSAQRSKHTLLTSNSFPTSQHYYTAPCKVAHNPPLRTPGDGGRAAASSRGNCRVGRREGGRPGERFGSGLVLPEQRWEDVLCPVLSGPNEAGGAEGQALASRSQAGACTTSHPDLPSRHEGLRSEHRLQHRMLPAGSSIAYASFGARPGRWPCRALAGSLARGNLLAVIPSALHNGVHSTLGATPQKGCAHLGTVSSWLPRSACGLVGLRRRNAGPGASSSPQSRADR